MKAEQKAGQVWVSYTFPANRIRIERVENDWIFGWRRARDVPWYRVILHRSSLEANYMLTYEPDLPPAGDTTVDEAVQFIEVFSRISLLFDEVIKRVNHDYDPELGQWLVHLRDRCLDVVVRAYDGGESNG
jgi:hypothetical protein